MGGGLMQLVAYGAQDVYLTGNPQITFFKVVYRRHTNFSMESIEQTWNGSSTTNGRCTATIARNGDLVHRMYIQLESDKKAIADKHNPGVAWINNVELEIGGQKIDKHSGVWMEAWAELTQENPDCLTTTCKNSAVASDGTIFQRTAGHGGVKGASTNNSFKFHVPLQFWFCRNPGLALPLIALQYHEVKVILDHVIASVAGTDNTNKLWCDYIYLDTDERRRFAQVSHEYLIEQVQEQSVTKQGKSQELNFNHPVKELVLTCATGAPGAQHSCALLTPVSSVDDTLVLKLNGHERFEARRFTYFSRVQVLQHHSGAGGLSSVLEDKAQKCNDSIGIYSFALKPEEHQPSGTCNFSRIDNAILETSGTFADEDNVKIFAVNYNVLRIMSGMGGLAYSN